MLFLADYTTFTNMEIKINCNTFQWYGRMPNVFEEHRRIVEIKTAEFQEALKVGFHNYSIFFPPRNND